VEKPIKIPRRLGAQVLKMALLSLVVFGAYVLGAFQGQTRTSPLVLALGLQPAPLIYKTTVGFPSIECPNAPELAEAGPEIRARRMDAIRRCSDAIRAQCQSAAGGDWDAWLQATLPVREELRAKLKALRDYDPPPGPMAESRHEALEGRDSFPLFEVGAREHLAHLYDPQMFERFRKERPVQAASRWFSRQGIDLISVMTRVPPCSLSATASSNTTSTNLPEK